jgi:hypothetical protein
VAFEFFSSTDQSPSLALQGFSSPDLALPLKVLSLTDKSLTAMFVCFSSTNIRLTVFIVPLRRCVRGAGRCQHRRECKY